MIGRNRNFFLNLTPCGYDHDASVTNNYCAKSIVVIVRMSLDVTKENCTLKIIWPTGCCGDLDRETLQFIVVIDDVESCYRMVTTPLPAHSLIMDVGIPPYFSNSPDSLVVTVHLCHALFSEVGWKTVASLTACATPDQCEEFDLTTCEHGPTGMRYYVIVLLPVITYEKMKCHFSSSPQLSSCSSNIETSESTKLAHSRLLWVSCHVVLVIRPVDKLFVVLYEVFSLNFM